MKSQSTDSETSQPVSFGEILKGKEKQLQQGQELSAAFPALTVLTKVQASAMSMPILGISPETELNAVKAQVHLSPELPQQMPPQALLSSMTNPAESDQVMAGETQMDVAAGIIHNQTTLQNELPVLSIIQGLSDDVLQLATKGTPKAETLVLQADTESDIQTKPVTATAPPNGSVEVTQTSTPPRATEETPSHPAAIQLEEKAAGAETTEPSFTPTMPAAEAYPFAAVYAQTILTAQPGIDQETPGVQSTPDVDQSVSTTYLPQSATDSLGKIETRGTEVLAKDSLLPFGSFVAVQPANREEIANLLPTEPEQKPLTPTITTSQPASEVVVKIGTSQSSKPISQAGFRVIDHLEPVRGEKEPAASTVQTPLVLTRMETEVETSKTFTQPVIHPEAQNLSSQPSSDLASIHASAGRERELSQVSTDIDSVNHRGEIRHPANESSIRDNQSADTIVTTEQFTWKDVPAASLPSSADPDTEKATKNMTFPVEGSEIPSSQAVNNPVNLQIGIDREKAAAETKTIETQDGIAVIDSQSFGVHNVSASIAREHAIQAGDIEVTQSAVQTKGTETQSNAAGIENLEPASTNVATPVVPNDAIHDDFDANTTLAALYSNSLSSAFVPSKHFVKALEEVEMGTNRPAADVETTLQPHTEIEVNSASANSKSSEKIVMEPARTNLSDSTPIGIAPFTANEQEIAFGVNEFEKPTKEVRTVGSDIQPFVHVTESVPDLGADVEIYVPSESEKRDSFTSMGPALDKKPSIQAERNDAPRTTNSNTVNVTGEAEVFMPQRDGSTSILENQQPEFESPVATKNSPEIVVEREMGNVTAQTSGHPEELIHPSDQPVIDFVSVSQRIEQEIAFPETKAASSQFTSIGTPTEISPSKVEAIDMTEVGAVNTDKNASPQPGSYTTLGQTESDYQQLQAVMGQKATSFEAENFETQVTTWKVGVEVSRPELETSVSAMTSLSSRTESKEESTGLHGDMSQEKTISEAKKLERQFSASDAVVGTSQPDTKSAVSARTASTLITESETESTAQQAVVNQKTTRFEAKEVETQFKALNGVAEASQPEMEIATSTKTPSSSDIEAQTVSVSPHVSSQVKAPSTNTAFDIADVYADPLNAGTARESVKVAPQNVDTQMGHLDGAIEGPQPDLDVTDTSQTSSFSEADHELQNVNPRPVPLTEQSLTNSTSNVAEAELTPVQPGMERGLRADPENAEIQPSDSEHVIEPSQPDADLFNSAKATAYSSIDQDPGRINSQTISQVTVAPANHDVELARPEAAPFQVEAHQETFRVKSKIAETQPDTLQPVVEFPQADSESPVIALHPSTESENTDVIPESVPHEVPSKVIQSDSSKVVSFKNEVNAKRPVVHSQNLEKQVSAHESEAEAGQSVPDLPVISTDAVVDNETKSLGASIFAQETLVTGVDIDVSQAAPSQLRNDQQKQAPQTKTVSESVSADKRAATGSPVNIKSSGNVESTAAPTVSVEPSNQTMVFIEPNQEFNSGRTVFARRSEPATDEVSLPLPFIDNTVTPMVLQDDGFAEVASSKKILTANHPGSTEQTILSVEKQSKPSEMPEPTVVVVNPIKEGSMAVPPEKGPLFQAAPHAVEVVEQVIHQLNGRIKSGPTSMHLQLNPEALGVIDVEVVRDAQGVNVTFFAEQASTGKLLETQLNLLRQSLMDSGVQLSGLNIGQHGQTGQEGGFQRQNTDFVQHTHREAFQREANPKESPRAERVTRQTSEVDYLI